MENMKLQSTAGKDRKGKETDIAIIGMACRFPGAEHYEEFWENLKQGRSSIQEIPRERWDWRAFWGDPQTEKNKSNSKWGGFIKDVDAFDPGFFNLSAMEAEAMDPQQRIMLELSWSCFEDAGICPSQLSGKKIGVFIGVFNFDYKELQEKEFRIIEAYHSTGTAPAVISNRISYYFNFKGPSFSLDTACSSSLNAIHSAVQSLHQGECCTALAGGISLLLTPTRHISFAKTGMLSPTGSCKTFDNGADGYVRGEGAGLILLKPLEKAIKDGDSIYGILKGSAINHSGKTYTLTYPNPEAQAEVIVEAHKRAGITPATISYVEAHGTGTSKGDPIEFQGLLKAFQSLASQKGQKLRKNYCGLGSVKTNIGHLESAAGIAGVIKVLLSMKYKQIPGLQNFKHLNQRISIRNTPFYIVDRLQEWKPLPGENNQTIPRRAGVSSFGFGGTNAHVVLEEAPVITKPANRKPPFSSYLICLSAKTGEALQQKEKDLAGWLEKNGPGKNLADISATLLLARERFGIRSAFVVKSVRKLQEKLKEVIEGGEAQGYFKENTPGRGKQAQPLFKEFGQTMIKEFHSGKKKSQRGYGNKLMVLAELYARGYDLDWKALYSDDHIPRISLPTYPFSRERYWIPGVRGQETVDMGQKIGSSIQIIHPLLQQNTSDFSEQRFSSAFTGQEFFLADHVVKGQRILPGVAYLEMVRAAVAKAAGGVEEGQTNIRLKNLVWARPIAIRDQIMQVHIALFPENNNNRQIAYEIYSQPEVGETEPVVHSQGKAVLSPAAKGAQIPILDMQALKAQCSQSSLSSNQCYEAFRAMGIDYGPGHQGIEKVYIGSNQVLAKLSLPSSLADTGDRFVLHPSLMDSALQASIVLIMDPGDSMSSGSITPRKPALPFALQELEVFGNCTSRMWALVRYADSSASGDKVKKFDIDLSDDQGKICVRMKEISFIALEGEIDSPGPSAALGPLMLHPCWNEQNIAHEAEATAPVYAQHLAILCEPEEKWKMGNKEAGFKIIQLQSKQQGIEKRFQTYAARVFAEVQSIIKGKPKGKVLIQVVVPLRGEQQLFAGLSGLLKTAQLENPNLIGQLIGVEPGEDSKGILEKLEENSRCPVDSQVRYQDGKRWIAHWSEIEICQETSGICLPWKDHGIYLITGGAGALGLIFAREIARQVKNATLILVGRSPRSHLNRDKQAQLKELETPGTRITYKQVDVTREKEVVSLIQSIRQDFGGLHGIIHGAGVIRDNFILKKTKDELQEVLASKVPGLVHLDRASKDLPLDFFLLFSSTAGVTGNIGQADYSTANAFMDAYASYRNTLAAAKQRQGQTLSINWPLWKEGGMHADEKTEKIMTQNMGIIAMQTPTGIRALYQSLASGQVQVMVIEGKLTRIKQTLLPTTTPTTPGPKKVPAASHTITKEKTALPGEVNLKEAMTSYLKQLICNTLKINPEQMDINKSLYKYGLDSIVVLDINNKLEQHFSNLSKTLFFEYSTINDLADYFTGSHKKALIKLFKPEETLNQTGNSTNTLQQNNEPPDHILYQPLSKSKRSGYLAKQHNNYNTRFDNSIIPVNQKPLIQPTDNITGILVDQIANHYLSIDDIIKLAEVDILTPNQHIFSPARDLPGPRLIHEKELENNPGLAKLITDIDNKYPPGAYIRLSYPYFFISPGKSIYIRLTIDQSNKLIIPFLNMHESIYQELFQYSQKIDHQLLMVDQYRDWIDSNQTRLIPLGVWQNLDINQFTLKGNKMRKLRYLIEKFKKSGEVKTEEYDSKSHLPFNEMRDLMIKWSESKKNIIHHSFVCMEDLLQQTLPAGHRAFLTYFNKKPCSIIVIEKTEDGVYLMDQEFYNPKSAPLGHLEYTIVEIIEKLKKENTKIFSLGLTWHPFIFENHPKKDPEGWAWLKEQNEQQTLLSRIFQQGKSNYQFKKKFGVAGEPIFAYLPKNAPFSLLLNYWPVFYQNSITAAQLTDKINKISLPEANAPDENETSNGKKHNPDKNERLKLLSKTGKLELLPYNDNPLDLLTDSWFSVQSNAVKKRASYLKTKPHIKTIEVVQRIFPFKHIFLTTQGRIAELLFYQVFPKTRKKILTTIPWTTTLMHQLDNGFDVIELPDPSVTIPQSTHLFKGEMDLEALKEQLQKESNNIALAGLEVLSNASGGHPVRLSHIHLLKTILQQYQIPLVLDASRIVRNAFLIKQYEEAYNQHTIWDIVKQTAEQADYIVTSLSKDFAVPVGGLIATNDDQLAADIKTAQILYGQTTADIESMIIHALSEQETILDLITRQMVFTRRLQDMLVQARTPILQPAYGHAVVIDVSQLTNEKTNAQKKEQFLKNLFIETGIRASIHQVGKQKNTILDQCIRLAFPLGLTKKDENSIYNQLQNFFSKNNMPGPGK